MNLIWQKKSILKIFSISVGFNFDQRGTCSIYYENQRMDLKYKWEPEAHRHE
jgi:hypothetical protein